MEEKNATKISLSTFFLILATIIIVIMACFLYTLNKENRIKSEKISNLNSQINNFENTIDNLQKNLDSVTNTISNTNTLANEVNSINKNTDKLEIPNASTNISEKEEKIISDYFHDVWITSNGENILAIDYSKRFCEINTSTNSKEYGTYSVKDGTSSSVPTITLTYTSGKVLKLELIDGSSNSLVSNDKNIKYITYEGYYFGASEGDEGIFNN